MYVIISSNLLNRNVSWRSGKSFFRTKHDASGIKKAVLKTRNKSNRTEVIFL